MVEFSIVAVPGVVEVSLIGEDRGVTEIIGTDDKRNSEMGVNTRFDAPLGPYHCIKAHDGKQ